MYLVNFFPDEMLLRQYVYKSANMQYPLFIIRLMYRDTDDAVQRAHWVDSACVSAHISGGRRGRTTTESAVVGQTTLIVKVCESELRLGLKP